jgi:PAS domain S-box-containing protein
MIDEGTIVPATRRARRDAAIRWLSLWSPAVLILAIGIAASLSASVVALGLRASGPLLILALDLALTALLVAYVQRERTRRRGVEQLIVTRTGDLAAANAALQREVEVRREAQAEADRSNAILRATFDAAPFAIIARALDRRVLLWNRAAEQIFGYRADEVVGQLGAEPDGIDSDAEDRIARIARGEEIRGVRTRRRRKDGKIVEVRFSGAPIYRDGRVDGYCGIIEDVTERNAIEQQLVHAQKMESIGNLTGGIAHDFNNLLAVVIGNLDLLKTQMPDVGETSELVEESLDAALSGAELTRRLLTFARRQPLAPQRAAPNELVGGMMKLLSRTLGEQIEISLDLGKDVGPVVVDPAQLECGIANLATNARDAMPQGGRLTIVTANRQLDEDYAAQHAEVIAGDYVMIEVTDTGTGMPPDVLERIFEPFYTTKERGKGTGLGLSMVFGFIKQSQGHISVYSEPGLGTTFRLFLPRADGDAAAAPGDLAKDMPLGANETILVVEDNVALRRVVVRQLGELGYRVLEADDALGAIDALKMSAVDLVFTDVIMPGGMDGYALARRVMSDWPSVKLLLTSGFPETSMNDHAAPDTCDIRLLSKPYRKEDLAHALRAVLGA